MVTTVQSVNLKLVSKPYRLRSGLIPMAIALLVGFCFSCLWLAVAVWMMFQPGTEFFVWGLMIALSTVLYCGYLFIAGNKLIADGKREYCLELTGTEAVLCVRDRAKRKKSTQMVLLNDVQFAEYYPYPDSASVILHAPYTDMEIPLWPLGAQQSQDVIDFLEGRGVRVVNVQTDDKMPDSNSISQQ